MRSYWLLLFILLFWDVRVCEAQPPGYNIGFEASAPGSYTSANGVNEWTITSQINTTCNSTASWTPGSPEFTILTTPLSFPTIGNIPNSPLGGTCIAQLNDLSGSSKGTKIAYEFTVTNQNYLLAFAYCTVQEDGSHICCEQSQLIFNIHDSLGTPLPCYQMSLNASGMNCPNGAFGYSITNGFSWTNWIYKQINLQPYIGQKISFEIIAKDCTCGQHFGTVLFDASFSPAPLGCSNNPLITYGQEISFCPGATVATIETIINDNPNNLIWYGPGGYWVGSGKKLTIQNPVAGIVYTLTGGYCPNSLTYTLTNTQIKINNVCAAYSCIGGTAGSASVQPTGNGGAYTYTWVNSTNSVVGNTQKINNLPLGAYTVFVAGPTGCGSASAVTSVNLGVNHSLVDKISCAGQTTTLIPPNGNNYQWYNGTSIISPTLGGISSTYTLTHPQNYSLVTVSYSNAATLCRDSITFVLKAASKGQVTISTGVACTGSVNGTAQIKLAPSPSAPQYSISFYVSNTGNTPVYSASLTGTSGTFTLANLSAGTYSLNSTDGLCFYTSTFQVFPFTISPSWSGGGQICGTNTTFLSTGLTSPTSYSLAWKPLTWIIGNPNNQATAQFSANLAPGTQSTITYTVDIKHYATQCARVYTFNIVAATPRTPTLTAIPALCYNAPDFTLQALPLGGYFSGQGVYGGVLTPSYTSSQVIPITYNFKEFGCQSNGNLTATILPLPKLTPATNTLICSGRTTTISLGGASTYTWTTGQTNAPLVVSPTVVTNYSVSGSHSLNACTNSTQITIYVTPTAKLHLPTDTTLCRPDINMVLSSTGAQNYSWSTGSTNYSVNVAPPVPMSYSVVATNNPGGCSDTAIINIHISAKPYLNVADSFSICRGEQVKIFVYGSVGYYWNDVLGTGTYYAQPQFSTTYKLVGINQDGQCFEKKNITVIVDECTSNLQWQDHDLQIFPNPASDYILVNVPTQYSYQIIDLTGRRVQASDISSSQNNIDVSQLPVGTYILKINAEGKICNLKFIKN